MSSNSWLVLIDLTGSSTSSLYSSSSSSSSYTCPSSSNSLILMLLLSARLVAAAAPLGRRHRLLTARRRAELVLPVGPWNSRCPTPKGLKSGPCRTLIRLSFSFWTFWTRLVSAAVSNIGLRAAGGAGYRWPDGQKQDTLGGQRIGAPAHPVMEPTRHEDISRCNRGQVTLPKLQAAQPTVPWPHNSRLQDDRGWVLLDAGSQSVGLWSLVHRLADA